jgi:hypothetical protein
MADHVVGLGHALDLLDGRQLDEFLVGARGGKTQGSDALGADVQRVSWLGVLRHEHGVQAVELRSAVEMPMSMAIGLTFLSFVSFPCGGCEKHLIGRPR